MAEPKSLPEFLEELKAQPLNIAALFYEYVEYAQGFPLDEYKTQELAVEECKFIFYQLTGIYFKDAKRFMKAFRKGQEKAAEEEE